MERVFSAHSPDEVDDLLHRWATCCTECVRIDGALGVRCQAPGDRLSQKRTRGISPGRCQHCATFCRRSASAAG